MGDFLSACTGFMAFEVIDGGKKPFFNQQAVAVYFGMFFLHFLKLSMGWLIHRDWAKQLSVDGFLERRSGRCELAALGQGKEQNGS